MVKPPLPPPEVLKTHISFSHYHPRPGERAIFHLAVLLTLDILFDLENFSNPRGLNTVFLLRYLRYNHDQYRESTFHPSTSNCHLRIICEEFFRSEYAKTTYLNSALIMGSYRYNLAVFIIFPTIRQKELTNHTAAQ